MKIVTGLFRFPVLALSLTTAVSAAAGVRFDFAATAPTYSYTGRMSIDGDRSRLDITSGNHPLFNANITLLTREGGADIIVIDHSRKTFFQRRPPAEMRGPLATATGIGRSEAPRSRVTKRRETVENAPGIERHTIRAEYDLAMNVEDEDLTATVVLVAEFDIDPSISQKAFPWGLQFGAKTGFRRIDNAIARRLPDRLPIRQSISASRQIAGGPVVTETFTTTVTNMTDEKIDPREFFAPGGYSYEEPVFSFGQ